jgi:hypothetical protein
MEEMDDEFDDEDYSDDVSVAFHIMLYIGNADNKYLCRTSTSLLLLLKVNKILRSASSSKRLLHVLI